MKTFTYLNTAKLIVCAFLLTPFSSCQKLKNRLNLSITNPFDFAVHVESNLDETWSLLANSSRDISRETEETVIRLSAGRALYDTPLGSVEFNISEGESYTWVVGEGRVNSGCGSNNNNNNNNNNNDPPGGLSNIIGKWSSENGCSNLNGEKAYFRFNADKSGVFFNTDCNSACAGYGITFHFTYVQKEKTITINYTRTDDYCNMPVNTPVPETASYTLS